MSMHGLDKMRVTVKKTEVLDALKKNRETHTAIVKEARAGYMVAARKMLEEEMKKLESGKPVRIMVHLELPVDNTRVYDTAIQMLEMHQVDNIELDAGQFRMFVMNKWDWMEHFLQHNSTYSRTAAGLMPSVGEEEN